MTKEEAKSFLIAISYDLGNMAVEYLSEKDGEKMREAIKALEQTRPSGKWIGEESLDGSIRYMCDNCKEFEYVDYYDFCPNCGADMREVQDADNS